MSGNGTALPEAGLIIHHKHFTSARLRFLRYAEGSVLAFTRLPQLAALIEDPDDTVVVTHPGRLLRDAEKRLGLPQGSLELEREFHLSVETPSGERPIFLARLTTIDPCFDEASAIGADFIHITEARTLPRVELELLRHAYTTVMGG